MLAFDGKADANAVLSIGLLDSKNPSRDEPQVQWLRRLVGDHVRRLVAASADGAMPQGAALESCRPDALQTMAILASVPPMTGGEYWTADVLAGLFARIEAHVSALAVNCGGDLFAAAASLGPGWRDVGKVSLHLAENKGDKSGVRPFAFLATFVSRADADGRAKHLPLSAALKAYASKPAALGKILAPLEAAAKDDKFLLSLLESRRIFQPCALSVGEAYSFLKGITKYEEAGLLVRTGRIWAKTPPKAKVSVSVGQSKGGSLNAYALCDFSVGVTINGEPLSEDDLAILANARDGLVRIRGEWVEVDHEKIEALLAKWKDAKRLMRDGLTMAQALRMLAGGDADSLAPAGGDDDTCEVHATGDLKELLRGMMDGGGRGATALPNGLDAVLRPYQKNGVEYLLRTMEAGLGACLADDMGLGKTLQVLTLIDTWKQRGAITPLPVLVVMPASLLANWKAEAARFTPDLKVGVLHPSDAEYREVMSHAKFAKSAKFQDEKSLRELGGLCVRQKERREADGVDVEKYVKPFDLVLTTYGQFTRSKQLRKLPFAAVIADEAQAIKNPGSGQSKALRSVVSPRRLALTGTPVENRMSDLWSIFDFINPGLLGSLKSFQSATAKSGDFSVVRRLTRPFILRRLKTDKTIIADLPDKTEIDVSTSLSQKQALLYERTVEELRQALEDVKGDGSTMKRKGLVLAYMLRFKQICDHPSLYLGTEAYKPEDSGKFVVLGERAAEVSARQEKMLVFTQYREMTGPLAEYLEGVFGREGLVLHGGTPVSKRGALVKAFQDPEGPPFFVLSVKAAGTGLNLTAANHVVHFDRWWNPAVENQASDRAYRIGQKRNVLIHKFVTYGTLEEKIDEMIKEKQSLADSLFADGGEKLVTEMSDAELMDLVELDVSAVEK